MHGVYFYNKTLRQAVSAFGTLFNDLYVSRGGKNNKRVPIAYGPTQKFLARVDERPELPDEHVAISLPRMSFEMEAPVYAAQNQRAKTGVRKLVSTQDGQNVATKVWQPTPYLIPFELNIMTRNIDEAHQILEQIIPNFKPSLGFSVYPIMGNTDIIDDVNVTLQTISKQDDYEGDASQRRLIIYTLQFEMRLNFYSRVDQDFNVIKSAIVNFIDSSTENKILTQTASVNPESADEDDVYTIDVTNTYGYE